MLLGVMWRQPLFRGWVEGVCVYGVRVFVRVCVDARGVSLSRRPRSRAAASQGRRRAFATQRSWRAPWSSARRSRGARRASRRRRATGATAPRRHPPGARRGRADACRFCAVGCAAATWRPPGGHAGGRAGGRAAVARAPPPHLSLLATAERRGAQLRSRGLLWVKEEAGVPKGEVVRTLLPRP